MQNTINRGFIGPYDVRVVKKTYLCATNLTVDEPSI